jgi:hypothetical protein
MRTIQLLILSLIISLPGLGQKEINDSKIICKEQISKCKVYSYENPSDYKDSISEEYITDIQYYDLKGRLVKHEYYGYSKHPQSTENFSFNGNKQIKESIDSEGNVFRSEIQVEDTLKRYLSIEKINNNKFQSKNITYYDSLQRKSKYESYNDDGTLKFFFNYDYVIDSNIVKTYIKGRLKEQIETISPVSQIHTKFDKSGQVKEKIFENQDNDGTVKEFCQIVYNSDFNDFYFHCLKRIYNTDKSLIREIDFQGGYETAYFYNEIGLLVRHEFIENGVLRQLTIYKYE